MANGIFEGSSFTIPISRRSLGHNFFESGSKYGNKICQIDATTGEKNTYDSIKEQSVRVALELKKQNVTRDDIVAFCTNHTSNAIVPMLGALYLGAKVTNLATALAIRQLQHLVSLTQPKIFFVEDASVANTIKQVLRNLKSNAKIINYTEVTALGRTPNENEDKFRPVHVDLDETTVILFTSGTTGLPKPICHTHSSLNHIVASLVETGAGGTVLNLADFYWISAIINVLITFFYGGCRVFLRNVDAAAIFNAVEKYRIKYWLASTGYLTGIINYKNAKTHDTSSMKLVHVGGNVVMTSLLERLRNIFKHSEVVCCYGMTETGIVLTLNPTKDQSLISTKENSAGKPLSGVCIKISDLTTGESLPPNQKGEIRIKGNSVTKGYYNRNSSDLFDKDGFLKTGDIGCYDKDSCFYVLDRFKDMFKFKAWQIIPSAIEAVLLEHPSVQEAVVFGVPWGQDGDAPGAAVVLNNNCVVVEHEIEEFIAGKVSEKEKLVGGVFLVANLLKTPTGKLNRKEIRNAIIDNLQT